MISIRPSDDLNPVHITVTVQHSIETESKEIAGKIHEKRSGLAEQKSQVSDVPIYLCSITTYATLLAKIKAYGNSRGLSSKDFPAKWPVTHQQAEDLLLRVQDQAENIKIEMKKTDKDGGFDFNSVPKGKYFLFASLVNKDQCRLWFKLKDDDGNEIDIKSRKQIEISFNEDDGIVIWSRDRKRGRMPRLIQNDFVPPPPPVQPNDYMFHNVQRL